MLYLFQISPQRYFKASAFWWFFYLKDDFFSRFKLKKVDLVDIPPI